MLLSSPVDVKEFSIAASRDALNTFNRNPKSLYKPVLSAKPVLLSPVDVKEFSFVASKGCP